MQKLFKLYKLECFSSKKYYNKSDYLSKARTKFLKMYIKNSLKNR